MGLCFLSMEAEITEGKGEGHAEPKFIPALCCSEARTLRPRLKPPPHQRFPTQIIFSPGQFGL